jgi:vitellogenic carboxypeptidase-like protein
MARPAPLAPLLLLLAIGVAAVAPPRSSSQALVADANGAAAAADGAATTGPSGRSIPSRLPSHARARTIDDASVTTPGGSPPSRADGSNGTTSSSSSSIPLPTPTHAGYLPLAEGRGEIFFLFFEAEEPEDPSLRTTPIISWYQGGPGCSSMFGAFYINGPYLINEDGTLRQNPGRWNRKYGTLFIDQPVAVGFSSARSESDIPTHELPLAADMYEALNAFYAQRGDSFSQRPLFITGESYAGKYVPSISHYILQAHAKAHGYEQELRHPRSLRPGAASLPPNFPYGGCAIGNGFTDAVAQTLVQAEVAHNMGLIDWRQRQEAEAIQRRVVDSVRARRYRQARALSDAVLGLINNASGLGTLEDVRREKGYDAEDRVGRLLNRPEVRAAVRAKAAGSSSVDPGGDGGGGGPPSGLPGPKVYESCSHLVDKRMGADVMHSTAHLVPDLLAHGHVMLYHGQFDAECGSRSNEAWLETLRWPGYEGFREAERKRWWGGVKEEMMEHAEEEEEARRCGNGGGGDGATPAFEKKKQPPKPLPNAHSGFFKSHMGLSHYIVRNAGHMVPHDRPLVGLALIEEWVDGVVASWGEGEEGGGSGGGNDEASAPAAAKTTAGMPRVTPGRRPPPLSGPWAGWGRRPGADGALPYDEPYASADEEEEREQDNDGRQRRQQRWWRGAEAAAAAAA